MCMFEGVILMHHLQNQQHGEADSEYHCINVHACARRTESLKCRHVKLGALFLLYSELLLCDADVSCIVCKY
jgi:hypothetical protein